MSEIDLRRYEGCTAGPWRWEFNEQSKSLRLVGGNPRYDLTVIDFARWGMSCATMRLRDTGHAGMQLMYRIHDRPDWIAPEPGREHHKHWHQLLTHPDALLSQDAPALLAEVERLRAERDALRDAAHGILLRFQSGNCIPVERVMLKTDDAEIQTLRAALEGGK